MAMAKCKGFDFDYCCQLSVMHVFYFRRTELTGDRNWTEVDYTAGCAARYDHTDFCALSYLTHRRIRVNAAELELSILFLFYL